MLLNKEILIGLFGGKKNIEFNICWNTQSYTVTGYYDLSNPFPYNQLDRPRINTWRSDGTNIVYMSAGRDVWNPVALTTTQPWGDRRTGLEQVNISLRGSQTAGVDFFTDSTFPAPTLIPATGWTTSSTGNPNEIKYQYTVTRSSSAIQNVCIIMNDIGVTPTPTSTSTPTPTPTPTVTPTVTPPAFIEITNISYNTNPEFITITNSGGSSQNMTGWYMYSHDGVTPPTCPALQNQLFNFPAGFTLGPGQSVNISSGTNSVNNPPTTLHWTTSFIWNNTGDIATLYNSNNTLVDMYLYGQCVSP